MSLFFVSLKTFYVFLFYLGYWRAHLVIQNSWPGGLGVGFWCGISSSCWKGMLHRLSQMTGRLKMNYKLNFQLSVSVWDPHSKSNQLDVHNQQWLQCSIESLSAWGCLHIDLKICFPVVLERFFKTILHKTWNFQQEPLLGRGVMFWRNLNLHYMRIHAHYFYSLKYCGPTEEIWKIFKLFFEKNIQKLRWHVLTQGGCFEWSMYTM